MSDKKLSAAAAALGRKGGKSKSAAKVRAAQTNGLKGDPRTFLCPDCHTPMLWSRQSGELRRECPECGGYLEI